MSREKKAIKCLKKMFLHTSSKPYIVIREVWKGKRPKKDELHELLSTPLQKVVIKYYSNTNICDGTVTCSKEVKNLQKEHISKNNYLDIAYNFMIGGDGLIYEGRGWRVNAEWPKDNEYKKYSGEAYLVAFIGDYRNISPTVDMMDSLNELVDYGVKKKKIDSINEVIDWLD